MTFEVDVVTDEGSIVFAVEADEAERAEEIAAEGARERGYEVRAAIALDVHRSEYADCLSDQVDEFEAVREFESSFESTQELQAHLAVTQGHARRGYLEVANPIGEPGTEHGPCPDGTCRHLHCSAAHARAKEYPCTVCHKPLGYAAEYRWLDVGKYAHVACLNAVEAA